MQEFYKKTIYLIRHGQTDGNIRGNWLGSRSINPLNEYGKKQAEDTARVLREKAVDASRIFSSPTRRALEHAEIIHKRLGYPIEKVNSISEINLGILEDRTREQGLRLVPQEVEDWNNNLRNFDPPLGETALEASERFFETIKLLSINDSKPDLIIVSHGVVIKLFLASVLKASLETGETKIQVPQTKHGSISVFNFDGQNFTFKNIIENKYLDSKEVANFG